MIHCPHLTPENKCRVASQVAECKVLASAKACEACQQDRNPQAVNVVTLGMAIVHRKRLGKPIAELRQLLNQYKPTGEEPVSFRINDFRPGPGNELKKMLAWFARPSDSCKCETRADTMNDWGVKGCRQNLDTIVEWLLEEAELDLNSIRNEPVLLATIRLRLSDISWWMRLLCQYIALRANGEDGEGLGRFWQSRFKAVRILDEETLLACAAYVDLNPIRAALAETLEQSDYTSVQRRIAALKSNGTNSGESQATDRVDRVDDFLTPVSIDEREDPLGAHPSRNQKRCSDKGFLAMAEADYLEILDWLARNKMAGKRGSTPGEAPAIFERLGIDYDAWSETVKDFGRLFKNVAGKSTSMEQARSLKTRRKFYQARV